MAFFQKGWKEDTLRTTHCHIMNTLYFCDIVDKHQYNQLRNAGERDGHFSFWENSRGACPSRILKRGFSPLAGSSSPNFSPCCWLSHCFYARFSCFLSSGSSSSSLEAWSWEAHAICTGGSRRRGWRLPFLD